MNFDPYAAGYRAACAGWSFVPFGMTEADEAEWMSGFIRSAAIQAPPRLEPIVAAFIAKRGVGA